jgi:hypothetical protein
MTCSTSVWQAARERTEAHSSQTWKERSLISLSTQAGLLGIVEMLALALAFRLYSWNRLAGWAVALFLFGSLEFVDGHLYWGHHNLFGLLN